MKGIKCFLCLDELESEELDTLYEDDFGNIICYDCYSYHYEMICPICEDAFDIRDFRDDKNVWIVIPVKDCDNENMQPGLYSGKYENFNYDEYVTGFGYLPEDRELEFVKNYISDEIEYSRFLCFDCGEKVKKEIIV